MAISPDKGMDPNKEAIFERAPFTKAFLDKKAQYDPNTWVSRLKPLEQKISSEIRDKLGEDWQNKSLGPAVIFAKHM